MTSNLENRQAKKKLKISSLMPYIDDLGDVNGLRLSGYLDCYDAWPNICQRVIDPVDRIQELLQTWLNQEGQEDGGASDRSWLSLCETLRKVGKGQVADRIEADIYPHPPPPLLSQNRVTPARCSNGVGQSALVPGSDPVQLLPPHSPPTAEEVLQNEVLKAADIFRLVGREVSSKWRTFGTFLEVQSSLIDKIRRDSPFSVDDCFFSMIVKWLQKDVNTGTSPRTWETILSVTKDTGFGFLSDEVRKKLISGQRQ